jgi:hypothetical protein
VKPTVLLFAAALILVPQAAAHVSVTPDQVEPGSAVTLTFAVPNEGSTGRVTSVQIGFPPGWSIDDAEAKPGSRLSIERHPLPIVIWRGVTYPRASFETFAIRVGAPAQVVRDKFSVIVRRHGGPADVYSVGVHVEPASTPGSHGLALGALLVAIAAAVLAAAAFFLGLGRWLRGA